ncbi:hypothetical protein FOL47_008693 [Perkinsus chesapeaki]|uniref:Uncharacterized protein n=1 Tax=Perkinsus chesapeaki TaxID=330153 RepID=A0A7J6MT94_PERCH|nr:hypothetical protein FOL47_008693 [Perkinsus chesapeaki]
MSQGSSIDVNSSLPSSSPSQSTSSLEITSVILTNGDDNSIPKRNTDMILLLPWTIALGCTLILLLTVPSVRHRIVQKMIYSYICLWYVCRRLKKLLGFGRDHTPDGGLVGAPRPL